MRRFAFLGATVALLFSGAVALAAASPTPLPSSAAHPSVAPSPSSGPAASTSPKPSAAPKAAATLPTFNATIQPLQIGGSATVSEANAGDGTVTLRITGLVDAQHWTVDIDGGTIARPNERVELAFKSGLDVTRLASDTVRIHLTKTEMAAFMKAQKAGGVVAIVSDGSQLGYGQFAAG